MKREKEINNAILNAIDILINRRLETSNFNTTIYGIIEENIKGNQYKVTYQDSSIIAYSNTDKKSGVGVYVLITNGDINEAKFILGSTEPNCFLD